MQKRTRRRVFIPDVRNHGLSPHSESHTYFDVASDLRRLCADRGLSDVTLVAHSMGARAAMLLSLLGTVSVTFKCHYKRISQQFGKPFQWFMFQIKTIWLAAWLWSILARFILQPREGSKS